MAQATNFNLEEKFDFSSSLKKKIGIVAIIGLVMLVLGIVFASGGGHGEHEAADGAHHAFHWSKRLIANIWINNVYFAGIAIVGVFFFALQYAAQAGWSTPFLRVPLAFGSWLPFAGLAMIAVFLIGNHDIFHWTHAELYDTTSPEYDKIIDGKKTFFFWPGEAGGFPLFYFLRMVVFFGVWVLFFRKLRSLSIAEDLNGGNSYWYKIRSVSAFFIVFFAVSSSVSAWDWVMSIDTHWFSTMFGWYVFASWFVSALAAITLIVVFLREAGYLKMINANHLHDLGKFVFAFSIFWTYIWFSQFLLIYYANIPEEAVYFVERMESDHYAGVFFINIILNFFFPFLVLMTRDSKRHTIFLKIVCSVILFGHWMDFFLMVTPGTLKENGGVGLMEVGSLLVYGAIVTFVILTSLAKNGLVPKNHPMLEESYNHHI
ncbi:quinol:cytochrome C oxidoreductase [Penaeicola halotolerans]|uniref:quinol:cytochrome C oxidoreductase n=1 Tax=Penaeicola halotolerans TaxID=2793196 RepID=UPI001CF921C8|nr:quinol:cytochrome C oxidoreductase [Penaeicola halotolerans]